MTDHIVTFNAGSSSIKFALFITGQPPRLLATGQVDGLGADVYYKVKDADGHVIYEKDLPDDQFHTHADALRVILAFLQERFPQAHVAAVGHRIVHGGTRFLGPVLIDDDVLAGLKELIPLAPLHQPHNIAGIEAAEEAFPGIPQVACFDTSFHRSHRFVVEAFALPRHFFDDGVRRYGFHGLSYEYISHRMREIAPADIAGRVVVAHLGNGASMCALSDGRSVDSTMGFSALDGLPMGTRCGAIDPGVLLHCIDTLGMNGKQLTDLLYKQSGLKGLSGISQDMRELEAADTPASRDAIAYYVFRIQRELGALVATLGGIDALVFTGGIGENAWRVREGVLRGLGWLGFNCDDAANRSNATVISTTDSRARAYVVPTSEEMMIAEHTRDVTGHAGVRRAAE